MKYSPLCWIALLALVSGVLSDGNDTTPKSSTYVKVKCTSDYMEAIIDRKAISNLDTDGLHLEDNNCKSTEVTDDYIKFKTPLDSCGTSHNISDDGNYLVYYNAITGDLVGSSNNSLITREHQAEMPFQCSYERRVVMSVQAFTPQRAMIYTRTASFGNFTFTMDMYKTDRYEDAYDDGDFPVEVGTGQQLYLEVTVENKNSSLAVVPITCKATPTKGYEDKPQYVFINESCTQDKTMRYDFKESSVQHFSIASFRFLPNHQNVYFHCKVTACPKGDSNSRCAVGCKNGGKSRRRREAPTRDIEHDLYLGPIDLQSNKQSMGSSKSAPTSMITMITIIAAVLGALVLALVVGLAVMLKRKQDPHKPQKLLVVDEA